MSLSVAVMGAALEPARMTRTWGVCHTVGWLDPTAIVAEPGLVSPETSSLLVYTPEPGLAASRAAAAVVASVRPDIRVRVELVTVSVGVLFRAMEVLPPQVASANELHAWVRTTTEQISWGAWLPSVTRLGDPNPTLGQHVASMFRAQDGFLALKGDPGRVAKVGDAKADPAFRLRRDTGPDGTVWNAISSGSLPEAAIGALFTMGLDHRPIQRSPLGDAEQVWGTKKAVEFMLTRVVSSGRPALLGLGPQQGTCRSCGLSVWDTVCPFCHVRAAMREQGDDTELPVVLGVAE